MPFYVRNAARPASAVQLPQILLYCHASLLACTRDKNNHFTTTVSRVLHTDTHVMWCDSTDWLEENIDFHLLARGENVSSGRMWFVQDLRERERDLQEIDLLKLDCN